MRHIFVVLWLLVGMISFQLQAADAKHEKGTESTSTMSAEDAANRKNKVEGDLDKEITNAKLRADSGSKSKFSASTSLNYRGGSIARPFGDERPNILGTPESQIDTSADASLRLRFRPNKNSSVSAGVFMGMKTPFHGDINPTETQFNMQDPFIAYNRTWAGMGLQNAWNISASAGTSDESKNIDQDAGIATDYNFMKSFGKFNIGATGILSYSFYSSDPGESDNKTLRRRDAQKIDRRADVGLILNPTVEYGITDKVSLRMLFSYFRWTHSYGDDDHWRLLRGKEYNSVGLGIAVIRDVYLYPNVQFLPREASWKYTNFGMSATVNVF